MKAAMRFVAVVVVLVVALAGAATAMAWAPPLGLQHPGFGGAPLTPVSPNAITQRTDAYTVGNSCSAGQGGRFCHPTQQTAVNNNHGLSMRPIVSGPNSFWSKNPFFALLPGSANFNFAGGTDRTSWAFGGLSIGSELYIRQGVAGSVNYPEIGNYGWDMDYQSAVANLRPGTFVPGYNRQTGADTSAWSDFPVGVNLFTGTSSPTPGASDYGCINCHSFGSTIVGSGASTQYVIQEWGVTCINCHGPVQAAPHIDPIQYNSNACYQCHNRQPWPASPPLWPTGRNQQIAMGVWGSGQAKDNNMQGFEVRKPVVEPGPFVPGTTETTGGAGHSRSLVAIQGFGQQVCLRCHSTLGYMQHSKDSTDIPYVYTSIPSVNTKSTPITLSLNTNSNVDCITCHTSHGNQQGLNQFGLRIPPENSYDAGAPTDPAFRACSDCHRESGLPFLPYNGTFDYNKGRISHPQREVFLGYGGYGVTHTKQTHIYYGAWCQYCHMPVTTGQPTANESHLFQIVWPNQTLSTLDVGWLQYPKGLGATTPVAQPAAAFPDDSCTGANCHLPSAIDVQQKGLTAAQDDVKATLQQIGIDRQTQIAALLASASAKLAAKEADAGDTAAWKMARINIWMVQQDGSVGMHNFFYSVGLLDWAINTLDGIGIAQDTAMTIAASNTTPGYQRPFTITGTLKTGSTPIGRQVVILQVSPDGTNWTDVATLGSTTGSYSYTIAGGLATGRKYRFVYEGVTQQYLPTTSPSVTVMPQVSLGMPRASTTAQRYNIPATFSGTYRPLYPSGQVNVWIRTSYLSNGKWTAFNSGWPAPNSAAGSSTRYSRKLAFTRRGTWRVQARFSGTGNSNTWSSSWVFTVR